MKARRGGLLFFVALIALLFAKQITYGAPKDTLHIDETSSKLDLHSSVGFLADSLNRFGVEDVGSPELLEAIRDYYNPDYYTGHDLWAIFNLKNDSDGTSAYILELGGYKEVIVFYKEKNSEHWKKKVTGRYIPYPENELGDMRFRINKVKIQLEPGELYQFIIYYPNPGIDDIKPEFIISSEAQWDLFQAKKNARSNVFLGLFFGVAIVLALINFIYFFIHKEKAYLQYTIYIFTNIYFESSRYGVVDLTPLIKFPILYFILENIFLVLTVVYYLLFLKSFINAKQRYPKWNSVANWLIIILFSGLLTTLYFIIFPELPLTAIEIRNYFLLLTLPVAGLFFINLAIKGNRIDKIFLLGSIVLVGTGLISLILDLFFKDNLYPDMIFQVGVIVELTIFSIGLGVKSKFIEKDKQEAQQGLIEQLKENERLQISANQELEQQVEERTREIQAQNEELMSQQEELSAHRDLLEGQNEMIARNNRELEEIKKQLEDIVESRTQQLKNANQELIQRNNQLEQYAYITAHNLRAPVARLKGLVYIFKKIGAVTKKNTEIVEKITNSALEMDEVLTDINKILELKNSNYSQTHSVEIASVIEKVKKILSDGLSDSHATISTDFKILSLHSNEPYLESIFYNLISNAIKYQHDSRDLHIDIKTFQKENKIVIEFKDNGVGIDLEKYGDKIFGLYQRFHEHVGGKGMGLYLVKTQVEALGGTIHIESVVGEGTKFIIELPASN